MFSNGSKKLKRELKEARDQAQAASKMLIRRDMELSNTNAELVKLNKAKTEFISLAAHQLRTPITTMKWYSEYLLTEFDTMSSDQIREYLEQIHSSGRHMSELIDTLLMMSSLELRARTDTKSAVDLEKLNQEIEKDQAEIIKRHDIDYVFRLGDVPPIITDYNLFKSILLNLVSNAIKYTPDGGRVVLRVKRKDKGYVDEKLVKEPVLLISIEDTGIGIPKRQQEYIFQRLFRADNVMDKKIEGTGLGLYIVKLIVNQLGGKVWFVSTENEGTTFYVTIPLEAITKK